mmetsp:Transcript_153835/g.493319  ORF Transcript_153835/g.493319 Transcript_153835/m.493319 type:complete len:303 (+) Transcript_153835:1665-2573(+)
MWPECGSLSKITSSNQEATYSVPLIGEEAGAEKCCTTGVETDSVGDEAINWAGEGAGIDVLTAVAKAGANCSVGAKATGKVPGEELAAVVCVSFEGGGDEGEDCEDNDDTALPPDGLPPPAPRPSLRAASLRPPACTMECSKSWPPCRSDGGGGSCSCSTAPMLEPPSPTDECSTNKSPPFEGATTVARSCSGSAISVWPTFSRRFCAPCPAPKKATTVGNATTKRTTRQGIIRFEHPQHVPLPLASGCSSFFGPPLRPDAAEGPTSPTSKYNSEASLPRLAPFGMDACSAAIAVAFTSDWR